jgi:6-phosphogluconolactonase
MGADGHTASLFPGPAAPSEAIDWVIATRAPGTSAWRITLTPVIINAAAEIVFVVIGAEKAARLAQVLDVARDPERLPAQRIHAVDGQLSWLVDAAAAGGP